MGVAIEMFLLILIGILGAAAVALFLTRDIWKRLWKNILNQDRAERAVIEESKLETEQRIRAIRELEDCLEENIRNVDGENGFDKTVLKWSDCSASKASKTAKKEELNFNKTNDE